jgi:hypothetical protein
MTFNNGSYADIETGEVQEGIFIPINELENYTVINKNQSSACKENQERKDELKEYNESNGKYFTMSLRESVNQLFANELFDDVERVTIMYISSFVDFNGYLTTMNGIPMDKKIMKKYVKITDKYNAFNIFYNKLIESRIIVEEGNKVKWDTSFSFKGKPEIYGAKSIDCYKTYNQTLRELYEANKPKALTIVFRLLPYVNRFTNELCRVFDKRGYTPDNLYSTSEVAELLGITDAMDIKNFVRRALKIKVGDDFVFMVSKVGKVSKVTINPKLVWMNNVRPDDTLVNLFELAKAKK